MDSSKQCLHSRINGLIATEFHISAQLNRAGTVAQLVVSRQESLGLQSASDTHLVWRQVPIIPALGRQQ